MRRQIGRLRRRAEGAKKPKHFACDFAMFFLFCRWSGVKTADWLVFVFLQHAAAATPCDAELTSRLERATRSTISSMAAGVRRAGGETPVLMSGAGHDAMAMARLTKVGMLFVRCRGGVSHSPEESVMDDDVWAAGLALVNFIDQNAVDAAAATAAES
jgi:acetylornithine deacetylase/succinyl-diaminopimelate desuccinylase-like protein